MILPHFVFASPFRGHWLKETSGSKPNILGQKQMMHQPLALMLLKGARYNIYLFGFFETIGYHLIAMHIFYPRPNLKTTVLYSQASGLCLIVRNTGSRWLDIFTCKNPRPTHHIYWPVLSLFYYVQTRILWKRTNLQNDKSNQIEWKWKYLLTEFIQGIICLNTHYIYWPGVSMLS